MRIQVGLFFTLVAIAPNAHAEPVRITDTLTLVSKAEDLLGGHTKSVTTVMSRVLVPPTEAGGNWTITYERMTADDTKIQGAQGRAYSVTVVDDALTVQPIAPTDHAGLDSVVRDLESLRPLFQGARLCDAIADSLCPALASFLRRLGEPTLKQRKDDGVLSILVTTPEGEKLEGVARLESAKWAVELAGTRRETIPFDVEGKGMEEATALISSHYTWIRELSPVNPVPPPG